MSGWNRTKRSSSTSQSPPRGVHAHVNDSHAGGSDFGRASSKLGSSRLVSAVSRAVAHAEERRGFAWRGCWAFNARGEARASSAAAAAATCRLLARSASPRPAPSLRLLRGAASSFLVSRPLSLFCARAVRQLRLAVARFGGALGRSTPGVCACTRRCSASRALAAPPARGRLVVLFGLLSLRTAGALCVLCAKPDFFFKLAAF